jgi:hypothetical protein
VASEKEKPRQWSAGALTNKEYYQQEIARAMPGALAPSAYACRGGRSNHRV